MRNLFEYVDNFAANSRVKSELQYLGLKPGTRPRVSVIMPIYKNPAMFRLALDSVLKQDCDFGYEVVVVDNRPWDGEKDEELLYVESLASDRVSYYRNRDNIGMIGNWNRGIELARAPYVTYCHNDDLLQFYCLSRLMELQARYGDRLIASEFNLIDEKGVYIRRLDPDRRVGIFRQKRDFIYTKWDIFLNNAGFGVGCLFNREKLIKLGGFNEEYYPSADYALFIKYIFEYGGVFNRVPTFDYRKAENESFSAYSAFVDRDVFFRECMLEHMKLPQSLGKLLIQANYSYGLKNFSEKWGKAVELTTAQKRYCGFMKVVNKLNSIRRFTL